MEPINYTHPEPKALRAEFWILLIVISLAFGPLKAHDFWLQPDSFEAQPGSHLKLSLKVGDQFRGVAYPRIPAHIQRFQVVGPTPQRARPVAGVPGLDPAGVTRLDVAGYYSIGYRSHPTLTRLAATKFNQYLEEEGLQAILKLRRAKGQIEAPGRESFSRCAKTLVRVGEPNVGFQDHELGLSLELVAETDPFTLQPGGTFRATILHEGEPVSGLLVSALHPNLKQELQARSDKNGEVGFVLPFAGTWMLAAVYMEATPEPPQNQHARSSASLAKKILPRSDWESLWASLTFAVSNQP